jgi:predicted metallopeptidase
MSRGEAIKVISHEIIHIYQYNSGQLFYENGEITWNFKKYDLSSLDYDNRPWEKEAFDNEDVLSKKIFEALY